jgi:tetratricopeptide (TPR) repeat protein
MARGAMALALESLGDFPAAIELWKRGGNERALRRVAQLATKAGRLDDALQAYYAARDVNPIGNGTAELARFLWRQKKDPEAAEAVLRQVVSTYRYLPYRDEWLDSLARILEAQGKWLDAAEVYGEIISENPRHWQPHINLGWAYYQLGYEAEAALAEFRQAIALDPRPGNGYLAIGRVLAREERFAEAEAWFAEAAEHDLVYRRGTVSTDATRAASKLSSAYDAAWAYFLSGETKQAARAIEQALKLEPAAPNDYYVLRLAGQIYASAGEGEKALAAYRQALAIYPNDEATLQAVHRLSNGDR